MRQGLIAAALLVACSGPQGRPATPGGAETAPEGDGGEPAPRPLGDDATTPGVTREGLGRILGPGPGHFFSLVHLEGVGSEDHGRLDGWRIESLPTDTPEWLDVRVGDVVTAVNGMAMVQPEDAAQIYQMLGVASEVRIDLTRDGERRAVRIPIIDEVEPESDGAEPSPVAPDAGPPGESPSDDTSPPAD